MQYNNFVILVHFIQLWSAQQIILEQHCMQLYTCQYHDGTIRCVCFRLLCLMPEYTEMLYTWLGLQLHAEWVSNGTERPQQNDSNGNAFNIVCSQQMLLKSELGGWSAIGHKRLCRNDPDFKLPTSSEQHSIYSFRHICTNYPDSRYLFHIQQINVMYWISPQIP